MPWNHDSYYFSRRINHIYIDNIAVDHFLHLTTVQVLKELMFDDIDNDVAWQYGQAYDTQWKDCPHLINKFKQTHPNILYMYILDKCLDSICDMNLFIMKVLQTDIVTMSQFVKQMKFKNTNNYLINFAYNNTTQRIGLTAAIVDQLDVIIESGKLLKNINKKQGKFINDRYIGNLKQLCSKVEVLDKMMIMSFNNVGNNNVIVSGEDSYFRKDQIDYLLELVSTMCMDEYNTAFNIGSRDFHFDTIRTMTYIASILLHSFYPNEILPEREEDMFARYASNQDGGSTSYKNIIRNIRELTDKSLAYVLRYPFHIGMQPVNTNKPETRNVVRPYSLQERYLFWWYKKCINCIYTTSE